MPHQPLVIATATWACLSFACSPSPAPPPGPDAGRRDASTGDASTGDASTGDASTGDASTSPGDAAQIWPPSTPWWTASACALPACSPSAPALPFDTTGSWTVTLATKSTDCNATIQGLDSRLQPGNVHTGSKHPLNVAGTCDYTAPGDGGSLQMGTYGGRVLISCEATQRLAGVVEVDVGTVTFGPAGSGIGQATAYFSNWPAEIAQPDNRCQAQFDVLMERSN